MRKKTMGKVFFLCIAMLMGLVLFGRPNAAKADGNKYYVSINGHDLCDRDGLYYVETSDTEGYVTDDGSSGWNARYIPSSGRLILHSYRGGQIVCLLDHGDRNFEIQLEGYNFITENNSDAIAGIQVECQNNDVVISSTTQGSLTINIYNTSSECCGINNCASGSSAEGVYVQGNASLYILAQGKCGFGIRSGGTVGILEQAFADIEARYNQNASGSFSAGVYSKTGNLDINSSGGVSIASTARDKFQHSGYGYAFYSGGSSGRLNCAPKSFPYVSLSAMGYNAKLSNKSVVAENPYPGLIKTLKQTGTAETLLLEYTSGQLPITGATFPDPSFRSYIFDQCDTDSNHKLSTAEIEAVQEIYVTNETDYRRYYDAYSLMGVEYFTQLTDLNWDTDFFDAGTTNGNLLEVDLRHNTQLETVSIRGTRLRDLYVSNLKKLTWLDCTNNYLREPLLASVTALKTLLLGNNIISNLSLSALTKLEYLDCSENQLVLLDVSANPLLEYLYCDNNRLGSLDLTNLTALEELRCGGNLFTSLSLTKNTGLTRLSVENSCLTSLNVSKNTALMRLDCSRNDSLKTLTLGTNSNLRWFRCFDCVNLKGVNVSLCSWLKKAAIGSRRDQAEDGTAFLEYYAENEYGSEVSSIEADPGMNLFYAVTGTTYSYQGVNNYFTTFATCGNPGSIGCQWQYRTSSSGTWKDCSSAMEGYRNATMTVPATLARNGYQYRCKVTNSYGRTAYSPTATFYVLGIKTHPSSVSTVAGKTVSFKVTAAGGGLKYQWQYKYPGESWKNSGYASGKTAELQFTAAAKYNGLQYRCKVTDAKGHFLYSGTALLSVLKQQPVSASAKVGAAVSFTAIGNGTGLKYQWQYKYPDGSWTNSGYASGKTSKLSFAAQAKYDGLQYRCLITDANGTTVRSKTVKLTILPAITQQPKSTTVSAGATARFTVKATGVGLTYQWQYKYPNESWKNSGYASARTATLEVPALAKYNGLQYRCIVTDTHGKTVTSSAVKLTVK